MTTSTQWQLAQAAAAKYQTILTPAILGPFAEALVVFAALQPGEKVLDVGCGTGAAARFAAHKVGPSGHVNGVDVNASMIDVAASLPLAPGAPIQWRVANAAQLPFDEAQVDAVLCAQTLQFLPDKTTSLSEMKRVLKSRGRAVISLWCPIETNPYFHALVETIAQYVGPDTAAGLQSAFALSHKDDILALLNGSGFAEIVLRETQLDLPLPPLAEFVPRHISATPMAVGFSRASPAVQETVVREVAARLSDYEHLGRVQIPFRSHFILLHCVTI